MIKYLLIFTLLLSSCISEVFEIREEYVIKVGEHSSDKRIPNTLLGDVLSGQFMISSSALYNSDLVSEDINKLIGFSDCTSQHHKNSIRIGWVSNESNFDIYLYSYVDGERYYEYITTVEPDLYYDFKIKAENSYWVTVDNHTITSKRKCNMGIKYVLYPYFGGNETAPHTMYFFFNFNQGLIDLNPF